MKLSVAAVALSLAAGTCAAQTWTQEPSSFAGIDLGKPFPFDRVPACPADIVFKKFDQKTLCYTGASASSLLIYGLPIEQASDGMIRLDGEKNVVNILVQFSSEKYPELLDVLQRRYGKPTEQGASIAKNLAGAELSSNSSNWAGKRASIDLHQRLGKMTTGALIVSFASSPGPDAGRDKKRDEAASKL